MLFLMFHHLNSRTFPTSVSQSSLEKTAKRYQTSTQPVVPLVGEDSCSQPSLHVRSTTQIKGPWFWVHFEHSFLEGPVAMETWVYSCRYLFCMVSLRWSRMMNFNVTSPGKVSLPTALTLLFELVEALIKANSVETTSIPVSFHQEYTIPAARNTYLL